MDRKHCGFCLSPTTNSTEVVQCCLLYCKYQQQLRILPILDFKTRLSRFARCVGILILFFPKPEFCVRAWSAKPSITSAYESLISLICLVRLPYFSYLSNRTPHILHYYSDPSVWCRKILSEFCPSFLLDLLQPKISNLSQYFGSSDHIWSHQEKMLWCPSLIAVLTLLHRVENRTEEAIFAMSWSFVYWTLPFAPVSS